MKGIKKVFKGIIAALSAAVFLLVLQGATGSKGSILAQTERFNMSYIYFGNSTSYTDFIDKAQGSIDDISPSYFDLNDDGTLKLTGAVSHEFIKDMHERGIKVTPFLSNHWDRQKGNNALAVREALSSQIVEAIEEYNLDGVNVDIENVTHEQRDNYTDLVRLLRQKLSKGKSLSVAVAPNPWELLKGWHGSYDYKALAQYSDYLMIMAYDEHYQGDPEGAGPVAGYPFVESTIKAALKHVSPDKLVLGIPFYGRLWQQGISYGGYGVSNNTVEELIKNYRGKVFYDEKELSPKATITVLQGDKKPKVFGRELVAGVYDIWYENAQSIKSKLSLVAKYNLKGTGSWSLGQEAEGTWDYYSLWLQGRYFSDLQNCWAKDSILAVAQRGWMIGVNDSKFLPDGVVTRAQAVTTIVRAMEIDIAVGDKNSTVFTDISSHWAFEEIEAARINGLIEGMPSGRFEPDGKLTREQITVILDRALKLNHLGEDSFSDVTQQTSSWSYEAIMRCKEAGILNGFPDGNFYPKQAVTRAQFASIMNRAAQYFAQ